MNDGLQIACIVWNVVGCVLIVLGNYYLLVRRVCMYGMNITEDATTTTTTTADNNSSKDQINRTRTWIWSFFYESINFYICCFFMFMTAVCYVAIFAIVICRDDWSSSSEQHSDMTVFAVSNAFFVISLVLYAWLVFWAFKVREASKPENITLPEVMTMINLCITAISACCTTAALSDSSSSREPWIITASVLIAFHCTVLDLLLWGCVWIFQSERKKDIHHTLTTNMYFGSEFSVPNSVVIMTSSSSVFDTVRIRQADYCYYYY